MGKRQLDVCKWLCEHTSGRNDLRRENRDGFSPLTTALFSRDPNPNATSRWLMLNGGLCSLDDSSDGPIDDAVMRAELSPNVYQDMRPHALSWVQERVKVHDNFRVFLGGTLVPPGF